MCPTCGSDDFEILETTLGEYQFKNQRREQSAEFHCIDCDHHWRQDSDEVNSGDPKPLKF